MESCNYLKIACNAPTPQEGQTMKQVVIRAIGTMLVVGLFGSPPALADWTFTISNSGSATDAMDRQVIDYMDLNKDPVLDCRGDQYFNTFSDVVYDPAFPMEIRSIVEFDIQGFYIGLPPGETITSATFNVQYTSGVAGLSLPGSLLVNGYVGNGTVTESDFQAGCTGTPPCNCGTIAQYIVAPDLPVETVISFDVTAYVTQLVGQSARNVGLAVRAGGVGGLWLEEASFRPYPQLVIQTAAPDPCLGILLGDFAAPTGVDGVDIQYFLSALLSASPTQDQICRGDFNGNGVLDLGDVDGMVAALLS